MCKKIDFRIECVKHGHPFSEALYPDSIKYNTTSELPCDGPDQLYKDHISKYTNVINLSMKRIQKAKQNREELSKKLLEYAKKLDW